MYQGRQQNETATSSRAPLALVQWLAAFCQFVHECRECQHDVTAHWPLCIHCDIRLGAILPAVYWLCIPRWGICLSVLWPGYAPS